MISRQEIDFSLANLSLYDFYWYLYNISKNNVISSVRNRYCFLGLGLGLALGIDLFIDQILTFVVFIISVKALIFRQFCAPFIAIIIISY